MSSSDLSNGGLPQREPSRGVVEQPLRDVSSAVAHLNSSSQSQNPNSSSQSQSPNSSSQSQQLNSSSEYQKRQAPARPKVLLTQSSVDGSRTETLVRKETETPDASVEVGNGHAVAASVPGPVNLEPLPEVASEPVSRRRTVQEYEDSLEAMMAEDDDNDPSSVTISQGRLPTIGKIGFRVARDRDKNITFKDQPREDDEKEEDRTANAENAARILAAASVFTAENVRAFQVRLKYHFMNPCQKYKAKKRKPFKLVLQLIKLCFVTLQLILFSDYQFGYITFIEGNERSFDQLFLKDWSLDYTSPIQTVNEPYAVFKIDDFYAFVNYTVVSYFTMPTTALGNFSYVYPADLGDTSQANVTSPPPIQYCKSYSPEENVNREKNVVYLGPTKRDCYNIFASDLDGSNFNFTKWSAANNQTIIWYSVQLVDLKFALLNQHIGSTATYFKPVCYLFNISISFDNARHTGKLPVHRQYIDKPINCQRSYYEYESPGLRFIAMMCVIDSVIMILCCLSIVLCARTIQQNLLMKRLTKLVWLNWFNQQLDKKDEARFNQYWYLLMIIGDLCSLVGSVLDILITLRVIESYTLCGGFLGFATLTCWLSLLKYLSIFQTYNILLVTMEESTPTVLRFMMCCTVIYFGFALMGWSVFGPFNFKFRTFTSTMQTLFSLMNGDDMFTTFAEMTVDDNLLVYIANQAFMYTYVSLFIYGVVGLLIGIIVEVYEDIKDAWIHGPPELSPMEQFMNEVTDNPKDLDFQKLRHSDNFICLCCMDGHDLGLHLNDMVVRA